MGRQGMLTGGGEGDAQAGEFVVRQKGREDSEPPRHLPCRWPSVPICQPEGDLYGLQTGMWDNLPDRTTRLISSAKVLHVVRPGLRSKRSARWRSTRYIKALNK